MATMSAVYLFSVRLLTACYQVIQKVIEQVSPERLRFINSFRGNVYDLATHPYSCRVLQRCSARPLLDEVHKYTLNLMQDQFS
jgi:pumilio RNA-binding family